MYASSHASDHGIKDSHVKDTGTNIIGARNIGARRTRARKSGIALLCGALAVFSVMTISPGPAHAAQDDARLDNIFSKLRLAETDLKAQLLERQIWQIWSERDNQRSVKLMRDGSVALRSRDFEGALDIFTELVEHDPQFAEGWNKRATLHYMMGSFDASVRDIERTLALEPRHFGALSGLGLIFMAIGNNEAAISSFEKALEINPHMAGPKYHINEIKDQLAGSPT